MVMIMIFGIFGDVVQDVTDFAQEVVPITEEFVNQTVRVLRGQNISGSIYITLSRLDKRRPGTIQTATKVLERTSKVLNSVLKTTPEGTPLRKQTIKTLNAFANLNKEYRQYLNNKGLFRFIDGLQARSALKKFNKEFDILLKEAGLPVPLIPGS